MLQDEGGHEPDGVRAGADRGGRGGGQGGWLLGLALAWRWRHSPYLAGAVLGVASLPKFFAAAGLLLFLQQRQWRALLGFAAVWTVALGLILVLNADTLQSYLDGQINSLSQTGGGGIVTEYVSGHTILLNSTVSDNSGGNDVAGGIEHDEGRGLCMNGHHTHVAIYEARLHSVP